MEMNSSIHHTHGENSNTLLLSKIIQIQSRLAEAHFNLDAFMQLAAEQMQEITPATGVVVELVEGDKMVYRAATGTIANYLGLRLDMQGSISGLCVTSNQVLRSDDTEIDSRVNLEACRKVGARSMIVAPLVHESKTVGVLKILSIHTNGFTDLDVQTLQIMAGFIASGIEHQMFYETNALLLKERTKALEELQEAQKKLEYLAHYDSLTDLPNRRMFNDHLLSVIEKAKRKTTHIALMYLDIDHFKSINDNLGHHIGDELLKAFAGRLKQCIRAYDLAARFGGDEFVLLLEDINTKDDAVNIAKKIITVVNQKFVLKEHSIQISTSIGIAFYTGESISSEDLIKQADKALYVAKESGRNMYHIYETPTL